MSDTSAGERPQDESPVAEGTGPDENQLDPAETGTDQQQDEDRSDAG